MIKNGERGRSMIEMLGVLSIIGIISVGGLSGYRKMISQHRINSSLEQVAMIASKISAYGSGADSYKGLSVASAIKLRAVQSSDEDGTDIRNPFGGGVDIRASWIDADKKDEQAFVVVFNELTEEACVALGSSAWANVRNSSFIGLGIGAGSSSVLKQIENELYMGCSGKTDSKSYAVACSAGTSIAPPMDAGTAALACNCADDNCVFMMKFF